MTQTTAARPVIALSRVLGWIGRRQNELSGRVRAAGDATSRSHGWTVTATTSGPGFAGRMYRDPFRARSLPAPSTDQHSAGSGRVPGCHAPGDPSGNRRPI
jgi:hypothetical protein